MSKFIDKLESMSIDTGEDRRKLIDQPLDPSGEHSLAMEPAYLVKHCFQLRFGLEVWAPLNADSRNIEKTAKSKLRDEIYSEHYELLSKLYHQIESGEYEEAKETIRNLLWEAGILIR